MAMKPASDFQNIYLLIFLFALVANRSIFAWPGCIFEMPRFSFCFSILFYRCMACWDLDSFHFSPLPDFFCYLMACNGPRATHNIYVSNYSCTVTNNFNMVTQEISLNELQGKKSRQKFKILNINIIFFVSLLSINILKLGRCSPTHIIGISNCGVWNRQFN